MNRIRAIIHRAFRLPETVQDPPRHAPAAVPFVATMSVDRAWSAHPDVPRVFRDFGLPSCNACAVRFDETLEEAAAAYSVPLDDLLTALNALTS